MKLTEKKLKQLILETLSQTERDSIMQMIETGDEGNIEQALSLLEVLGGDLEIAEALMRLPTNKHTLERGWKMFSELASIPEPTAEGDIGEMSAFHIVVYPGEIGEKIADFLRRRNWKEYDMNVPGIPDEYDFVYMKTGSEVNIMLPFREKYVPQDDEY